MSLPELAALDAAVASIGPIAAPRVGVVLGSGLGAFADELAGVRRVPYAAINGMPRPAVQGHAGTLCFGEVGGVPVACLAGRVHAYEGHPLRDVVFGVSLLWRLGCSVVLLTNAAGGIAEGLTPGELLLIEDHINFTGQNPLVGPSREGFERFPDMSAAYDPEVNRAAQRAAAAIGVELRSGVYAGMLGPTYETPAEIRALRTLGASVVGMSTVLEVIALRQLGVRVGAVSCVTNLAAGVSPHPLSHAEVERTATLARGRFSRLLGAWIAELG